MGRCFLELALAGLHCRTPLDGILSLVNFADGSARLPNPVVYGDAQIFDGLSKGCVHAHEIRLGRIVLGDSAKPQISDRKLLGTASHRLHCLCRHLPNRIPGIVLLAQPPVPVQYLCLSAAFQNFQLVPSIREQRPASRQAGRLSGRRTSFGAQ